MFSTTSSYFSRILIAVLYIQSQLISREFKNTKHKTNFRYFQPNLKKQTNKTMSPINSSSVMSHNERLLIAVLSQIGVGRIDYDRLARDIGAPSRGAAQVRWSRFNIKLKKSSGIISPSKPSGVSKSSAVVTPNGVRSKIKDETSGDDEAESASFLPETTPVRRMPVRKARVTCFKMMMEEEGSSSSDDEEEEDEMDGEDMDMVKEEKKEYAAENGVARLVD